MEREETPPARAITRPLPVGGGGGGALVVPGARLGDWIVERALGEGGMGTVWAATHAVIGKRAAIKVVRRELCASPDTAERFVQEARIVNQIGHPNIVDIFHIGRLDDGRPFLVMELLRGRTLAQRLADGRIPAVDAVHILLQVCAALSAAHARGVIHRDLKPDNVFVGDGTGPAQVKLVDWGIAKLQDGLPLAATLTSSGVLVGTPQYVSPEQARGRGVDERSDLYSLGVIAYELFLEEPPFQADNVADLIAMHLREPVPPPSEVWPDVPPALERLLLALLAKDPAARPALPEVTATLRAVRDELAARPARPRTRRLASGSIPPALAATAREPVDADAELPLATRRGWIWWPVAVGGIAAALAATVMVTRREVVTPGAHLSGRRTNAVEVPTAAEAATPVEVPAAAPAEVPGATAEPAAASAAVPPAPPAAAAPTGALDLRVSPRGARVAIDGVDVRLDNGRVVQPLPPGRHEIVVEASGRRPYRRTVEVGDEPVRLEIDLAPRRARPPAAATSSTAPRRDAPPIDPDGTLDPFAAEP